ncbi:facilitated trehalose transporter Tret1-like [Lucilia cuprina]|uniref:facilitated trehalose transporter Tret1-like n=1 Tax=Lucilia cuprina TaxID=7375 RepID=UPI001F065657|nr:facilitated trehalose transporter Tret1-like [Lucilia cuprina]
MFFKLFKNNGVFNVDYRRQLLASISATIMSLLHGIGLGWLSPMLPKLQSPEETPFNFVVDIHESSWIGAAICIGGVLGNLLFLSILDRFGRKIAMYGLAFPHMCLWLFIYFAHSIELLYAARIFGGLTGGGIYIVIPIFISEISDPSIRGRLTSLFALTLNLGVLIGYILSSYVPYHIIPWLVLPVPVMYLIIATYFPETPQYLLRKGHEEEARKSFMFYKNNIDQRGAAERITAQNQFEELKIAITHQESKSEKLTLDDIFNRKALKIICTGIVLMILNIFCGSFALINYMSSIFTATKTEMHPDINTIIIGCVQVFGTYTATILVDRFGRKILMIVSTSGMGMGMAAFGMYAFFAEETDVDLTPYSSWLPLLLMALIIFLANVGIISVTFVVLVEILPPKIRSIGSSFCLALLSLFALALLRFFPVAMYSFGLSATMWFCATVCAFGLFYISVFLEETKGKSMNTEK